MRVCVSAVVSIASEICLHVHSAAVRVCTASLSLLLLHVQRYYTVKKCATVLCEYICAACVEHDFKH